MSRRTRRHQKTCGKHAEKTRNEQDSPFPIIKLHVRTVWCRVSPSQRWIYALLYISVRPWWEMNCDKKGGIQPQSWWRLATSKSVTQFWPQGHGKSRTGRLDENPLSLSVSLYRCCPPHRGEGEWEMDGKWGEWVSVEGDEEKVVKRKI